MEIIKLKKEVGQRPRVQSLLRVPGGFLAAENGEARSSGGGRASLSGGRGGPWALPPPGALSARSSSSSRPPGPEESSSAVAMAMRREEGGPSQGGFPCVERGGAPVGNRFLGWGLDELRRRDPSPTAAQALPVPPTP